MIWLINTTIHTIETSKRNLLMLRQVHILNSKLKVLIKILNLNLVIM